MGLFLLNLKYLESSSQILLLFFKGGRLSHTFHHLRVNNYFKCSYTVHHIHQSSLPKAAVPQITAQTHWHPQNFPDYASVRYFICQQLFFSEQRSVLGF